MNKIGPNWQPWPGWMADVIRQRLPQSLPIYGGFLSAVVLPHIAVFAHGVACAEVVVGCCLVLGLATCAAAAGGALLTLNYLMLNGAAVLLPHTDPLYVLGSNDPVFILGCVAVAVGAAGRTLGLDQLWSRYSLNHSNR